MLICFVQMSNKQDKDFDMNENSVSKILLEDEIQETQGKDSKDTKRKPKRLSTSSTQEAGSGSPGKTRKKPKIIHTPSDATGLVRIDKDTGTFKIVSKAVALENKKLKAQEGILEDRIVALKAQIASYKNPGSQAVPSPPCDPLMSGGLAGTLSTIQFNDMISIIGEQVKLYQDTQSAARPRKELNAEAPSVDPEAPGPSSRIASHLSGLAGKSRSKVRMDSSLGNDSGDDLDITGSMDDHNEDIIG